VAITLLGIYNVYSYNDFGKKIVLFDKRGHFYSTLSQFIFSLGSVWIYITAVKRYRSPVLFFTDRILPIIGLFLLCTYLQNRSVAQTIWNFPDEQRQLILEMDDSTKIKTGKDTVYLGRTASSIFFLIRIDSTKLIINSGKVKTIHVYPHDKMPLYTYLFRML